MSALGFYFGPKAISIVEAKGRNIGKNIHIPCLINFTVDPENKKPAEEKIVEITGLIQTELRNNGMTGRNAFFSLPGRDLIIRNFEVPLMPANELDGAISFEAKKYIPFKIEDLISAYDVQLEKASRTNNVLFIGIKKETLERYLSIAGQLDINIGALEYSAFSLNRLFNAAGISNKGTIGMLVADLDEADEVNFTVFHNGFPLFSRDIAITAQVGQQAEASGEAKAGQRAALLDKLKAELRVSLGYYQRKFYDKGIEKVYLILDDSCRQEMEVFIQELNLIPHFMDLSRVYGKDVVYSSSLLKGFSASLVKEIKSGPRADLLLAREKFLTSQKGIQAQAFSFFTGLRLDFRVFLSGCLICLGAWGLGQLRAVPLRRELDMTMGSRVKIENVNMEDSTEQLISAEAVYKRTLEDLSNFARKQVYFTEILEAVSRLMPEGVWLNEINLDRRKDELMPELVLKGMAYLKDRNQERDAVNKLISDFKANAAFLKYFRQINISSLDTGQYKGAAVTTFLITCKSY